MLNDWNKKNAERAFTVPFVIEKKIKNDNESTKKDEWQFKYKLFADAKNLHGQEYEIARQTQNEKTIKFIIRAGIKIDEKNMRIRFNGQIYNIENVDDIGYSNEILEIRAKRQAYKK